MKRCGAIDPLPPQFLPFCALRGRFLVRPGPVRGTRGGLLPSGGRDPLQDDAAADVVGEVLQADLDPRPRDPDRAHEASARRVLLRREHGLDARAPVLLRRLASSSLALGGRSRAARSRMRLFNPRFFRRSSASAERQALSA